jgi:WD40 repeat protein
VGDARGPQAIIEEVTYHPDGRSSRGRQDGVRDRSGSGKVSFTIEHKASMMSCEIAPDGRTLLTPGGKHHTRLWDLKTGGAGPVLEDPDEELIYKAMFTPDGKSVLTMNGRRGRPVVGHRQRQSQRNLAVRERGTVRRRVLLPRRQTAGHAIR